MKDIKNILPNSFVQFLEKHSNKRIECPPALKDKVEIDWFTTFSPEQLCMAAFEIDTYEYYVNHDEPGKDPELRYAITGIDLINGCENYTPEGILIYFPQFSEFGSWDCDHAIITMYPGVSWEKIQANIFDYVNGQWYPDKVDNYLLRPWADDRCKDLKPLPKDKD
jgi:hypothetical protein